MSRLSITFKSMLLLSSASLCLGPIYAQETPETVEPGEERTLSTVVVRGAFIPDEKRETSEISSLLDSSDFEVQGDADAAAALRRVTGLSLSRGKFIFVRGLNERYSSSTLNGSPLPSPEPLRRVAPLDLFPTSVLESVLVQKTWSPEYSAEFAGGLIEMRTKAVPDSAFFETSLSVGGNTDTTWSDGLLYEGGGADWTGFDDGTRNTPALIGSVFDSARITSFPEAVLTEAGRQLVDTELWVVQEGTVPANFGFDMTGGQAFDFAENVQVGVLGTFGYDNSWDTKDGVRRDLRATATNPDGSQGQIGNEGVSIALDERSNYKRLSTENNIRVNALGSIGFDIYDDHEVTFTGLITRSTTKEARTLIGFTDVDFADGNDVRVDKLEWFERQVATGQARGEHFLPFLGNIYSDFDDFKLSWRGSYSEAFRDAPYERTAVYEDTTGITGDFDGVFRIDNVGFSGTEFSKIEDDTRDIGVTAELPLNLDFLPDGDTELKAGWSYYESNRDTISKIYRLDGPVAPRFQDNRIDIIFGDPNIGPGALQLREVGGLEFPEAFRGHLELDAYFFQADIQLTPYLRMTGGVRYEDALQESDTLNVTLPDNGLREAAISSRYGLPSFTATWNFTDNMQLRAAYSETITRPQFRELAFVQFVNSETDEAFVGNPFLINSEVTNFDARWEYYFARDEFITIGAFYKEIDKPIEEVSFRFGDANISSFINAPSAQLQGVEAEFEKIIPLHDWLGWSYLADKDIVLRTNYAFTDSEVSAAGDVIQAQADSGDVTADTLSGEAFIIDGRQLQGQSDHIFNFQLGYDDMSADSQFRVLVNWASERIRRAENRAANVPAIIERLPLTVDMTYQREFDWLGAGYQFSVKAQNIFGEDYEAFQEGSDGEVIIDGYERGTAFSVGFKRFF